MKYRRFGKTEVKIPLISSGGMRFQSSWNRDDKPCKKAVEKIEKIISHGLSLGINHFETAQGYGTSEKEMGIALQNFDRTKLIIQTKGGPKETCQEFLDMFDQSMLMLKLDYIDLFAIHGINNKEILEKLQGNGTIDAALKLKAQGRIKALGFSTHGQPDEIINVIKTDAFDYVNLWHSYIYQFNTPAIDEAAKHDMGVFIISPNDKGGNLYAPPKKLIELTKPLSPMAFNDLFILSNPNIHTISCGAAKESDYDEHVDAVNNMDSLKEAIVEITQRLNTELENIFEPDWPKNYLKNLPTPSQAPHGLNIPIIVWLWNLIKAFDLTEYAKSRYNLMGNGGHWFPGCKHEDFIGIEKDTLKKLLVKSPYADRVMDILEQVDDLMAAEKVTRLSKD